MLEGKPSNARFQYKKMILSIRTMTTVINVYAVIICLYTHIVDQYFFFKCSAKFCPLTKDSFHLRSKQLRSYVQKLAHYADYSYENCM